MRILILGATGNIASCIVNQLYGREEAQLRLTTRSPEKAARLQEAYPKAEVLVADWMEPERLTTAFADVDRAVMITPDFTDEAVAVPNVAAAAKTSPNFELLVRLTAVSPALKEEDMTAEWLATK